LFQDGDVIDELQVRLADGKSVSKVFSNLIRASISEEIVGS